MNEIDEFLSQPLPGVADDGFSARVVKRVRAERLRERIATIVVLAVCAVVVLASLPWQELSAAFEFTVAQLANSTAVAAAVGAIVLSLVAERQLFRS